MYGRVKNRAELQVPAGKEGADQILNDLFAYGSTKLDRIAFQEALDEIGAKRRREPAFLRGFAGRFCRGAELLADNSIASRAAGGGLQSGAAAHRSSRGGSTAKSGLPLRTRFLKSAFIPSRIRLCVRRRPIQSERSRSKTCVVS